MKRIALLTVCIIAAVGLNVSVAWPRPAWKVSPKDNSATFKSAARKVDINLATTRELEKLPGIGSELAERVIRYRPYSKLDELIVRKVLSRKQFARIKERIRVNSNL